MPLRIPQILTAILPKILAGWNGRTRGERHGENRNSPEGERAWRDVRAGRRGSHASLLKRHEIQVLLNAGHSQAEVACLAKVSERSVRRIAAEAAVEHLDDRQERVERGIGGPTNVQRFWSVG